MIGSTPTLSADNATLYVGAHDGVVYAIDATNGTELWRFVTAGVIFASPALTQGARMAGQTIFVDPHNIRSAG